MHRDIVAYYVVLYRPKGSYTYTPYPCDNNECGNFFSSKKKAQSYIDNSNDKKVDFIIGTVTYRIGG